MFERFDEAARAIVVAAVEEARGVDANHVGTEHLLLAVVAANEEFCADLGILRSDVLAGLFDEGGSSPEGDIPFTPRTVRALELASRCGDVGPNEILAGLLDEGLESRARDQSSPQHLLDVLARAGVPVGGLRLALNQPFRR